MQLTALYPGLTREEVQAEVGSPLRLTDTIQETAAPTTEELRVIREEVDPSRDVSVISSALQTGG